MCVSPPILTALLMGATLLSPTTADTREIEARFFDLTGVEVENLISECAAFHKTVDGSAQTSTSDVELQVGTQSRNRVRIGFNSSYTAVRSALGSYPVSVYANLAKQVPIEALRFPGGTVANYFDWDQMVLEPEWQGTTTKPSIIKLEKAQRRMNRGEAVRADFASFLAVTANLGAIPIVALNVYAGNGNVPALLLDNEWHTDVNIGSIWWELGNELDHQEYLRSKAGGVPWSTELYSTRTADAVRRIRSHYPAAKVGVIGGDLVSEKMIFSIPQLSSREAEVRQWREFVRNVPGTDGVVFHPYIRIFGIEKWTRAIGNREVATECLDFLNYIWINNRAEKYPDIYEKVVADFYPGREVWLTEAGILPDPAAKGEKIANFPADIRELLITNFALSWLRNGGPFRVLLFHVLGFGRGDAVPFHPDGRPNAYGRAMSLVRAMTSERAQVFDVQIRDKEASKTLMGRWDYQDLVALAVSGKDVSALDVHVINLSYTTAYRVSFVDSENRVIVTEGQGAGEAEQVREEQEGRSIRSFGSGTVQPMAYRKFRVN